MGIIEVSWQPNFFLDKYFTCFITVYFLMNEEKNPSILQVPEQI